jgi:hypothetical protein
MIRTQSLKGALYVFRNINIIFLFLIILLVEFSGVIQADGIADIGESACFACSNRPTPPEREIALASSATGYCPSFGGSHSFEYISDVKYKLNFDNTMVITIKIYIVNPGGCVSGAPCPTYDSSPEYVNAWIDWNGDKDFDDPGEKVIDEALTGYTEINYTGNMSISKIITIPSDSVGSTWMRVNLGWGYDPNDPCQSSWGFGDVVDKEVNFPLVMHSYEALLRSQTGLMGSFENLLKNTTLNSTMSYKFLDSFDDLADRQQHGLYSFEDLVSYGWSDLDENEKISLTESFEDLLRRQAIILTSNEDLLKRGFCKLSTDDEKKLLDRFEARLKAEVDLLKKFEDWLHYQQMIEVYPSGYYDTWMAFLSSFEDLIRRQSNLLDSFEMLLKIDCTDEYINVTKSADPLHVQGGSNVTYIYTVTATNASYDVKDIIVKDSLLGEVGTIDLLKYGIPQILSVTKPLFCADCDNCECKVCNFATACGEVITPNGNFTVCDVSNEVCLTVHDIRVGPIYPGIELTETAEVPTAEAASEASGKVIVEVTQAPVEQPKATGCSVCGKK